MRVLILLGLLSVVYCAKLAGKHLDRPDCAVSDWSSWGKCESKKLCRKTNAFSYHVEPTVHDHGAARMKFLRQKKLETGKRLRECRSDPECTEFKKRSNQGFVSCENGFVDDLPCDGIDQMSFIDMETLSGNDPQAWEVNDIWGWLDPENGDEYAIVCMYSGTSFVRMTDPENPVVVGYLPTRTFSSTWRDAKVIGNYVYIVSEASDHGMQVYDLTQLRSSTGFQEVSATAEYSEFGNCHNIVANPATHFVYAVGATDNRGYPNVCNGGLHVIDVSDPTNPTFVTCFGDDGYVHDAECTFYHGPDTEHVGKEICFCYNEDTLTIVDATNKDDMTIISKESYGGYMYTHQGWMTEDHTVLLLDDELDEFYASDSDSYTKTYIWDIVDLETPTLQNIYYSSQKSIDHNQYILGNLTYQSNYYAGLRILAIDQENYDLHEVAYFDTHPDERADFSGSWSNYPYFPSGNIALGSLDYGFFVVRPNMGYIQQKIKTGQYGFQERTRQVTHRHTADTLCPSLLERRTCVPEC